MPKKEKPLSQTRDHPVSQWFPGVEAALEEAREVPLESPWVDLSTAMAANSFWIIYRSFSKPVFGIRACWDPQFLRAISQRRLGEARVEYRFAGGLGAYRVVLEITGGPEQLLHYQTELTPGRDFLALNSPRELYFLDAETAAGREATLYTAEKGPITGVVWLSLQCKPPLSLLYFPDFTALCGYLEQTRSSIEGSVALRWPELGFSLPQGPEPLKKGKPQVVRDAWLAVGADPVRSEFEKISRFIDAVAAIYLKLERPATRYYDWGARAAKTLVSLQKSTLCHREIRGHRYLNAYVGSSEKPPESMVNCALRVAILDYQAWSGKKVNAAEWLAAALGSFFDVRPAGRTCLGVKVPCTPGKGKC